MKNKLAKNIIITVLTALLVVMAGGCTDEPVYMGDNRFFPTPTRSFLSFSYSEERLFDDGAKTTPTEGVKRDTSTSGNSSRKGDAFSITTATPVPTKLASYEVRDGVKAILGKLRTYSSLMSDVTTDGLYIFCDSEEDVNKLIMKASQQYSVFPILYADENLIHTPDYYMELYPELTSLEIDYSRSGIYKNGIVIDFKNVETKAASGLLASIRTGDDSYLSSTDKWVIKEIRRISDELKLSEKSDINKVILVYDYIIKHTTYSNSSSEAHSSYGLLKNGKAVCDGYAETFMLFMVMNGLEAETVTGQADGGPHAWNQVKVDGKWYNLDLTWDDPIDTATGSDFGNHVFYKYFMLSDDAISKTHTVESAFAHKCNDDSYRLFCYKSYMVSSLEDVERVIKAQLNNKIITVVYPAGDIGSNEVTDIYFSITGKNMNYFPAYTVNGYRVLNIRNK